MNVRACAVLVAGLLLIGACGSASGPSDAQLAAQDRQVLAAAREGAAQARVAAAANLQKRRRQQARIAVLHARRVARRARRRTVLQSSGVTVVDICAPIRGGTRASRRELRRLRRQALYGLNLRC